MNSSAPQHNYMPPVRLMHASEATGMQVMSTRNSLLPKVSCTCKHGKHRLTLRAELVPVASKAPKDCDFFARCGGRGHHCFLRWVLDRQGRLAHLKSTVHARYCFAALTGKLQQLRLLEPERAMAAGVRRGHMQLLPAGRGAHHKGALFL